MIIEFGRWQLRPDNTGTNWILDTRENWEKSARQKGNTVRPPYQARYFQWNTLGNAFLYAASRDLMDKDGTLDALDAAREIEAMLAANIHEARRCMDYLPDPFSKTAPRVNGACQTAKDGNNG